MQFLLSHLTFDILLSQFDVEYYVKKKEFHQIIFLSYLYYYYRICSRVLYKLKVLLMKCTNEKTLEVIELLRSKPRLRYPMSKLYKIINKNQML